VAAGNQLHLGQLRSARKPKQQQQQQQVQHLLLLQQLGQL
jgi:hypothetical protein